MSGSWNERPVLVTGAAGFVGSWVVRALLDRGANVTAIVRDPSPRSELVRSGALARIDVVRGDVRDQAFVERVVGEREIDTVFHLAAQTSSAAAARNPVSTFETNVAGTWTLLEACRRAGSVRSIVVASSDKAYGESDRLPYDEGTPLRGRSAHDVTKTCADLIAQSFAASFGLPVALTRCGTIFGGGDRRWSELVPGTIRRVFRGERPILDTDGTEVRDFVYVEDAVSAMLTLGERLLVDGKLAGEAFNVSYESPLSRIEVVRRILAAMGSDLVPQVERVASPIPAQHVSADKARVRLGFQPAFDVETGLRKTISWYERAFTEETAPASRRPTRGSSARLSRQQMRAVLDPRSEGDAPRTGAVDTVEGVDRMVLGQR
jgi:CDP-glucose 4,6-dehydratase